MEDNQLSELSKTTLKDYVSKATAANKQTYGKRMISKDANDHIHKQAAKRGAGLAKALDRIHKPTSTPTVDKEALKKKLSDLHAEYDPQHAYSDDYSHHQKHARIASQIDHIKKQLGEEEVSELQKQTLGSYIAKADAQSKESAKKGARQKNLERAYQHFRNATKRSAGAAKATSKLSKKLAGERWGIPESEELDEAGIVVHSSKEKDGKEYQVLKRKGGREFVIQSKKKDGTWHTHDAVGSDQRAKQLIVTGRYSHVNEAQKVQSVEITVPALIRLCEIAREDVDGDTDLHELIEALIEKSNGVIDSQSLEDVSGDGDSDEDDMNESFVVYDHLKKPVHVSYSESGAKKKAEELSNQTGKKHTVGFKREAIVKEGVIVSADKKVDANGRQYPRSRKILGTKTDTITGIKL